MIRRGWSVVTPCCTRPKAEPVLGQSRHLADLPDSTKSTLRRLLSNVRYELLPIGGALEQAAALPIGAEVAVTADPELGMAPTIDLCVELSRRGFGVLPHLSAQLTRDRSELAAYLQRLADAGIERALVIGGVADQPGEFLDAMALLVAIEESGASLRELGIAGYPEGHQEIPDEPIERSLFEKAPHSAWITTQICMDAAQTGRWIERQRRRGIDLPIWLGITGVADITGLMSMGLKVGAGRSLQFMFEHPRLVTRLLRPGGRSASDLVVRLAGLAADTRTGIAGFHLFTYNQVRAAERWRNRLVSQIE